LDLHALVIGLLFNPVGVYKAFVRGRRTRNLYSDKFSDEQLMDMTISEIRGLLLLNEYKKSTRGSLVDFLLLLLLLILGTLYSIFTLVALPFILLYTMYASLLEKNSKKIA
jgi:uncharacterized membrane protein YqaE (UPF0057 family)